MYLNLDLDSVELRAVMTTAPFRTHLLTEAGT